MGPGDLGVLGEPFSPPSLTTRRSDSFVAIVSVFQGQIVDDRTVFGLTFLSFRWPLFAPWDEALTKPQFR